MFFINKRRSLFGYFKEKIIKVIVHIQTKQIIAGFLKVKLNSILNYIVSLKNHVYR